ncbi:hypothetical protein GUITHDRAFT_136343 [Guillardia theta CCMP2712]|uniref:Uncharacterized protein n=1 Tax=Guillardia theta (strain CCMP2712) TaxID=905079 RepID=L1JM12_GUITC|nr:hypothetical protein GUITHDRAFT_136343 [Guillardia theta CCMP2712]EKX49195.1 hypothetical protein GUITHDRAFT_136343 [Guillardia theta CCMP2712]|eukprot:XP_005836175.1 hypothetical protein GUITHDRAFT_136343 [Guillardia theta CCMP2712]
MAKTRRWSCSSVAAFIAVLLLSVGAYLGIIVNTKSKYRSALARTSALIRFRSKRFVSTYISSRRFLHDESNKSLSTTPRKSSSLRDDSGCDCGCCESGYLYGCSTCCPCAADPGPCSTRRTYHCGCCDDGWLYGCSGVCGGAGNGVCSERASSECGCCSQGIVYGCVGTCGDAPGTGPCSLRSTGSCGCCDSGFFWGCRGSCGGTTFSSVTFEFMTEKATSTLTDLALEYTLQPKLLAQVDIIKTSFSMTADMITNEDFTEELLFDVFRTATGFVPPPYGTVIQVAWGAYDFVTTYQKTGSVWEASLEVVSNNLDLDQFVDVGKALSGQAKASKIIKNAVRAANRRFRKNRIVNGKLRTTTEPLLVKISFFMNVTNETHLQSILDDIGQEKMFSKTEMDPVKFGFWDDTATLAVGCMFHDCVPQVIVQPSSDVFLNVSFSYAAASDTLDSTTRDMIRAVVANVAGPPALQSDVIINSETSESDSSTFIELAIMVKSRVYTSMAMERLTDINLNEEGVKAQLGVDMFSSVNSSSYSSNYTITPLGLQPDQTSVPTEETPVTTQVTSASTPSETAIMMTPEPSTSQSWECTDGYKRILLSNTILGSDGTSNNFSACLPDALWPHKSEFTSCTAKYNWEQLAQIPQDKKDDFFITGGLGKLMVPNVMEVWVCEKNHVCATENGDNFFCFTYDEDRDLFYPWGLLSVLKLRHKSIFEVRSLH